MNIRHTRYEDIPRLKEIWSLCFGDIEGQGTLFFDKRFRPEHSMALYDGEALAAMLFMLPLTVCSAERDYDARYIYAVATHPDHQNKGYSTQLLDYTNQFLKERQVALTVLVPASDSLFDYYGKRGYETQFFLSRYKIEAEFNDSIPLSPLPLTQLEELRNHYFSDCTLFAKWDRQALSYCDLDVAVAKGEVLAFDGGYAVCYPDENCIIVKELAGTSDYPALAGSIAKRYQTKTIKLRTKPTVQPSPYAMTRWLTEPPVLSNIDHSYISLVLD